MNKTKAKLQFRKSKSSRGWEYFYIRASSLLFILSVQCEMGRGALGICQAGEFRCHSSGRCVPKEQVCDQVRDCEDGLDESDLICSPKYRNSLCGAGPKKHGIFQCQYGGCIPINRVCDGSLNCIDGSDESEFICGANSCLPGQFRCKYGACIPDQRMCNGQIHCPDGSDETEEVCQKHECREDQFRCKYGGCISLDKICDGWRNCADNSDEAVEICLRTRAKLASSYVSEEEDVDKKNEENFEALRKIGRPVPAMSMRRPTMGSHLKKTKPTTGSTTTTTASTTTTSTTTTPVPQSIAELPGVEVGVDFDFDLEDFDPGQQMKGCILPEIPPFTEAFLTSCRTEPNASYCRPNITSAIVPIGFSIEYSCSAGYLLNGPIAISCRENGLWSSTPPTCEQILDIRFGLGSLIPKTFETRCPPLDGGRGVKIECIDPKNLELKSCTELHKPGTEARFSCADYYRPAGDLPMIYEKCGEDGIWSPGVKSQFSCIPDCGLSEAPKTPYITNGVATKRGQWPWHVGLFAWNQGELKYLCGGSLISEFAVLTSAHCVAHAGHIRNASTLVVFLGKQHIVLPDPDPYVQERRVAKVIVEDSFNQIALDSDIAVLALETPAVLTFYVRPVCYPQTSNSFLEEYQLNQGNKGVVLGWGLTENGTLSDELRMTELPVVSAQTCQESHPDFFASMTRSTTFCAGYRNGTSVCNGDSGGGLFFRAIQRGHTRWYLQGLVSYGVPKVGTKQCASSHYAVFTRVGRYGDWLVKTLSRENLS